ncbi:hypothetical protein N7478_011081 [Penicillium angulare]|uniref:uncharacterized protein n=1 Tax=Penicillium angulare TaxID=116970 RepID=UPI002541EBF9|nr:uncharacterized protein N7478_011081 [Penicillium angulare]KAJ5263476.1 hypothetical protein N7478_011081 [Penicillium angulare]
MIITLELPFERHSRRDAVKSVNLDFDARVPIPFSVFPSSYRSDAVSETTQTRVEGEVQLDRTSHVEREDTRVPTSLPEPRVYGKEEFDIRVQDDRAQPRRYDSRNYAAEVDLTRESYPNYNQQSSTRFEERPQIYDQPVVETQLDITERDYRRRTSPTYDVNASSQSRYPVEPFQYQQSGNTTDYSYDRAYQGQPAGVYQGEDYTRREIEVERPARYNSAPVDVKYSETTVRDVPAQAPLASAPYSQAPQAPKSTRKMGYYDDEGQYHSFRRGVERAADRILHPFHDRDDVVQSGASYEGAPRETVRVIEPRNRGTPGETVSIPCHFVRIGDILILQGRPCQVIRISVSSQTGQHRYLGVDLFTRQLQEESSFVSNPSPSVVVQTMLGPVFKTYRILDVNGDSSLTAMTESGDIKQALPVITQGGLFKRISDAFANGRGSVRALVINDGGRELVVDYKVIHGSRL